MESLIIQPGNECFYFVAGDRIGKIEVPSMAEMFNVSSGHKGQIIDMCISSMG